MWSIKNVCSALVRLVDDRSVRIGDQLRSTMTLPPAAVTTTVHLSWCWTHPRPSHSGARVTQAQADGAEVTAFVRP